MNIVSRGLWAVVGGCFLAGWAVGQAPAERYPYPIRTAQAPAAGTPARPVSTPQYDAQGRPIYPPQGNPQAAPQPQIDPRTGRPYAQPVAAPVGPNGRPLVIGQAGPLVPPWSEQLTPEHIKYLDQLLAYWEFKSGQITKFRCAFERLEYDRTFGPQSASSDPANQPQKVAKTYATGTIQYEKPDKGSFKIEELKWYTPPAAAGQQATYEVRPNVFGEHWVCDGKSVFEYKPAQKVLAETKLPFEMQGKAIANGPLPFMFGAEAEALKRRYWMRVITPKNVQNQYWIEAWPKLRGDAENFSRVDVIISSKDYLPDAMQMYQRDGSNTVFQFTDRKVNGALDPWLPFWKQNFFKPELPAGWRKEVEDLTQIRPAGPAVPPPGQFPPAGFDPRAVRPTGGLPR